MSASFSSLFHRWTIPAVMMVLVLFLAVVSGIQAHQVPSLTVEALFTADRGYTLRVSLDPRLFLSDQPSSLPPVPLEWYRDQSQAGLEATRRKAADYLRGAIALKFGDQSSVLEHCEYQPMDGATNMPISADTKEVHLLATLKGRVPEGARDFAVSLSQTANVSMILMNSFEGTMERRPNVIFPGETTRPYELAFADSSVPASTPAKPGVSTEKGNENSQPTPTAAGSNYRWPIVALVAGVIAVLLFVLLRRAKT